MGISFDVLNSLWPYVSNKNPHKIQWNFTMILKIPKTMMMSRRRKTRKKEDKEKQERFRICFAFTNIFFLNSSSFSDILRRKIHFHSFHLFSSGKLFLRNKNTTFYANSFRYDKLTSEKCLGLWTTSSFYDFAHLNFRLRLSERQKKY